MTVTWIILVGLIADVVGFGLIGWELLTHPDKRLFLHGGNEEFNRGRIGFGLVMCGFALQAAAQAIVLMGKM